MAISKIKPIKKSLKKAIDYITNPEKTDQNRLVSSFGCSSMTADIEMQMTAARANKPGIRIAYHLIQSFSPEDKISPDKAHEMGKEFANRLLEGKYEYVVSTHIDKGHIHNHVIFNATSFIDQKKYHMPVWFKYKLFNINDQICRENNVSVIENRSKQKGKEWYENEIIKEGKSWKEKLKIAIDDAICEANDYEHFVQIMKDKGFEYKETDKVLKFKGSEGKFTRVNENNFGEFYSKEMMLKRINDKEFNQSLGCIALIKKSRKLPESQNNKMGIKSFKENNKVNLIIDIEKNIKAQQSKGYEHTLVMANINTMAKTISFLQKNRIKNFDELENKQYEVNSFMDSLTDNLDDLRNKKKSLTEKMKYCKTYEDNKLIAEQALKESKDSKFITDHKDSLLLFGIATEYLKENQIVPSSNEIVKMKSEYKNLSNQEDFLKSEISKIKQKTQEYNHVTENVRKILNMDLDAGSEKKEGEYVQDK